MSVWKSKFNVRRLWGCHMVKVKTDPWWSKNTKKNELPWTLVMVYFMCQLGWATMPKYLVRYYAGCFYEGSFSWNSHLNQWTPEWSRLPFIMCVGLNRAQDCPSQRRENSPSRMLLDLNYVCSSLGLQPAGPPWRFWTHKPPHETSQVAQW